MDDNNKKTSIVEKFEEYFAKLRKIWNVKIFDLNQKTRNDIEKLIESQAEAISYRQQLNDEISDFAFKLYKESSIYREKWKERYNYYITDSQIKLTDTTRKEFVEIDLDIYDKKMKCIDEHIKFLSETRKTIDNYLYGVKNTIVIYQIIKGLD
jgi:hypothetical protein